MRLSFPLNLSPFFFPPRRLTHINTNALPHTRAHTHTRSQVHEGSNAHVHSVHTRSHAHTPAHLTEETPVGKMHLNTPHVTHAVEQSDAALLVSRLRSCQLLLTPSSLSPSLFLVRPSLSHPHRNRGSTGTGSRETIPPLPLLLPLSSAHLPLLCSQRREGGEVRLRVLCQVVWVCRGGFPGLASVQAPRL